MAERYAEQFIDWLVELGYTHCFFLAGGNIMHLLDAARTRLTCVPVVHEVTAGIAAEYFNAARPPRSGRAFAMVTAGPGVTNILTAVAGAYLESRELLVIAGQVKSSDLADGGLRQRGIQEVPGVALAAPVCKRTMQLRVPRSREEVEEVILEGRAARQGPVFIEFCLDTQGAPALEEHVRAPVAQPVAPRAADSDVDEVLSLALGSKRPVILLGGGMGRSAVDELRQGLHDVGIPIATTWNALDRIDYDDSLNLGRPDTWGMRWSNIILQQADLIIALGARLSLQQTGFHWSGFAPIGSVVHVDVDTSELAKGHPRVARAIHGDAEDFAARVFRRLLDEPRLGEAQKEWALWREFASTVRARLPLSDSANVTAEGFLDPFEFVNGLSEVLEPNDILIPCSSGGASTVLMQSFRQRLGQTVMNNKALASMGYGLGGAIGASLANPGRRIIHVEGDGGFAQNLQDLGTVTAQRLPVKMFLFANEGYASIRMTQRSYFGGAYVGCDVATGLGLPDWPSLFAAYGIPCRSLDPADPFDEATVAAMQEPGPAAFVVPVDPEQTYYPKITSRLVEGGGMESNPLHRMSPDLHPDLERSVLPHLLEGDR